MYCLDDETCFVLYEDRVGLRGPVTAAGSVGLMRRYYSEFLSRSTSFAGDARRLGPGRYTKQYHPEGDIFL